jgi:hypothetical protein
MGRNNKTWIRVDLVVNVSMPSPTVAFGALTSQCTCTVLECQLALQAAGLPFEDITSCATLQTRILNMHHLCLNGCLVCLTCTSIPFRILQTSIFCKPVGYRHRCILAGIGLQLWELLLLASRYAACDNSASFSWASEVRWPAILRDLGVTHDSRLPAGRTASLAEVADLLCHPPNVRYLPAVRNELDHSDYANPLLLCLLQHVCSTLYNDLCRVCAG